MPQSYFSEYPTAKMRLLGALCRQSRAQLYAVTTNINVIRWADPKGKKVVCKVCHISPFGRLTRATQKALLTSRPIHSKDGSSFIPSLGMVLVSSFFLLAGGHSSYCDNITPEHSSSSTPSSPSQCLSRFAVVLRPDQIETDLEERTQRAKPWNSYHSSQDIPQCILYPETTEDVSAIMKYKPEI